MKHDGATVTPDYYGTTNVDHQLTRFLNKKSWNDYSCISQGQGFRIYRRNI